jgi:hypothetical protein
MSNLNTSCQESLGGATANPDPELSARLDAERVTLVMLHRLLWSFRWYRRISIFRRLCGGTLA